MAKKRRAMWKCPVCKKSLGAKEKGKGIVIVWCTLCNMNLTYPVEASTEKEALDLFYETYKMDER